MKKHELTDYIKLLLDSNKWYLEKIKNEDVDQFQPEVFCIAVIFNAWSALEGFINYVASLAKFARTLESHERACLEEINLRLGDSGEFEKHINHYPTTQKFLFLLNRFSLMRAKDFKKTKVWNYMIDAEKKRNIFIHPKEQINVHNIDITTAEFVDKTVRDAIEYLKKNVLKSKRPFF